MQPRLLTSKEAAAYLRMCESTFRNIAPVSAVDFGERHARMKRFDKAALDRWLDEKSGITNDAELSDLERFLQKNGQSRA